MAIQWRHDFDAQAELAAREDRPLLLDFSAAPM